MPDTVLKTISMKLHDGKYDVLVAGKPDRGTYSLEPSSHPKRMTIVGTEGPNQGRRFLAIYEISGETLRMCYDLSGKEHPAEFKSLPGTQLYLVTYSRKKRSSHSSTAERQPFRPRNLLKRPSFFSFVKSIRHLTRSWGSLKVAAVLMG
jgi:uncharacterized protein (TIGR03067 family)